MLSKLALEHSSTTECYHLQAAQEVCGVRHLGAKNVSLNSFWGSIAQNSVPIYGAGLTFCGYASVPKHVAAEERQNFFALFSIASVLDGWYYRRVVRARGCFHYHGTSKAWRDLLRYTWKVGHARNLLESSAVNNFTGEDASSGNGSGNASGSVQ